LGVAITDFPTKAAIVVRDDLAVWQRLNVTGFLVSRLVRAVGTEELDLVAIGIRAPHRDADAILRGLQRHS
jgi:hypothetical protein